MATRVYRQRRRQESAKQTRERILEAARELLSEGAFQDATVEQIADRAGVARATLYQHFGSRMGLVDAFCDVVGHSPEYAAMEAAIAREEPVAALEDLLAQSSALWAGEQGMHSHLYGLAEIDAAAAEFVERQTRDRHSMVEALAEQLDRGGELAAGVSRQDAVALLLVLTSFPTYSELSGNARLSREDITALLRRQAGTLLAPA